MASPALTGLPGSAPEPGSGPAPTALFDDLLDDGAALAPDRPDAAGIIGSHRAHREAWYRDLLGALRVPAAAVGHLVPVLATRDHGLPVVLVADAVPPGPDAGAALDAELDRLRHSRHQLLDDDRLQVVGVELTVPPVADLAGATGAVLTALDFSTPAWLAVPNSPGWEEAFEVLAQDGAENLALRPKAWEEDAFATAADVAAFLRLVVDRDLSFSLSSLSGPVVHPVDASGPGLLNLLCAVRAALSGASVEQIAAVLDEADPVPLLSAVRGMSQADASVVRVFVHSVGCLDVAGTAAQLLELGLAAPDPADA